MNQPLDLIGYTHARFDTGAVELHYVVGPNNGPALLLIPAQMATWESYGRVLEPLARSFQVYAVDVRGHGLSGWTTGDYSFASIGPDLAAFLRQVVGRPALVSGSSSGGLLGLWLAANLPDYVVGLVLEDAPLFSAEMPRFRDHDRFVYHGLRHTVEAVGDVQRRDLADYFRGQELPIRNGRRVRRVPDWFVALLSLLIRRFRAKHPGQPVELRRLPHSLRLLIKSLSMFDPDFARAFVDGRFYAGLDHTAALKQISCPLLVLHADWFRDPRWGLVGAMDGDDAARVQALVPRARYKRVAANHVIHYFKPRIFVRELEQFAATLPIGQPERAAVPL